MPESRVALVTGGSRGIGRAVAVALAGAGHPVAINYNRSADEAKQTLFEVEAAGGSGICVQADVGDPARIDACFAEVEAELGEVTVLVNNAGTRRDALALAMSDADWDHVVSTNLYGPFACSRRALRSMLRARWGRIVNVSSVAGISGSPGQANYSAAKAGLIGLTKTLAREVATKGITVNAVAPGPIATELIADLSEKASEQLIGQVPAKRAGTREEVASLIAYLCSEQAGFVTGAVLPVDGGMTA